MVFVEASFPRGGVAKSSTGVTNEPEIEFGATTLKRKKEKLHRKQRDVKRIKENEEKDDEQIEAVSAELLSFKTITEGMIIMGCINKIEATHLFVSLPGRLTGKVLLTSISQPYVDIVNKFVHNVENIEAYKPLEEMFQIGQIVCVKVMKIGGDGSAEQTHSNRIIIQLSMNPVDLQSDFQHNRIPKSTLLCVAIEGIEDHGYTVQTGIQNLRAFIPTDKANTNLGIGEIIFCRMDQYKPTNVASTAVCHMITSIDQREIKQMNEPNLSYILPSIICPFKITKILTDGIQGTIMNETFTGYINEHQLSKPLSQPDDYKVDQIVMARILYVMPLTKLVYLSLNLSTEITGEHQPVSEESKLIIGDIIQEARVIRIGTGGLILKLNAHTKGLLSFKAIRSGYTSNFDSDELMAKYHKNSRHTVRVTAYDPMDSLFVCSNNEKVLAEKFYTISDVDVGDYVDAVITHNLNDGGYSVRVGHIKGYLEKLQLSSATPASKLEKGSKLRCRILRKSMKDHKVLLTNRKEFMDENSLLLKSHEKAVVGLEYHGMIAKIYPDGYLISFCNYVKGMLYKHNLDESSQQLANYFHIGQIQKFRIMFVRGQDQITLGMGEFISQTGTTLRGKVSTVGPDGINISFTNSKLNGFIPSMFLTNYSNLVPLMHETYKPNENLDTVCISHNMYSIRDVEMIRSHPIKKFDDLIVGDIIPAYVKNVSDQVIDLHCMIENYKKVVKLHGKMLIEDYKRVSEINLMVEQMLLVRVMGINAKNKALTCSAKLSHVWNGDTQETARQFRQYFQDIQRIRDSCLKFKNPLASLEIGSIVTGKIIEIDEMANLVKIQLPNKIEGRMPFKHLKFNKTDQKNHAVGGNIECLIVWIDYGEKFVHLHGEQRFIDRKTANQHLDKKPKKLLRAYTAIRANILLILDDMIILYPKFMVNRFIFVPTRLHYNDLLPVILTDIRVGEQTVVSPLEIDGDYLIGMLTHVKKAFDQLKPDREKFRLKRERLNKQGVMLLSRRIYLENNKQRKLIYELNKMKKYSKNKEFINETTKQELDDSLFFVDTDGLVESDDSKLFKDEEETTIPDNNVTKSSSKPKRKKNKKLSMKISQLDGATNDSSSDEEEEEEEFEPQIKTIKKSSLQTQSKGKTTNLPGISNFWTTSLDTVISKSKAFSTKRTLTSTKKNPFKKTNSQNNGNGDGDGDDDDSENDNSDSEKSKKKLKLSTEERFRMARNEEARVRQIEESIANDDDSGDPTTVEQFDRAVMAQPSSSLLWIKYMVFHMQTHEIHRARSVARNALKRIGFRETEELFNIWIALLNLELRFGEKEEFDSVLKEALQLNDPFKIYSKCVQMLADAKKIDDLSDMIQSYTKKFRSNLECWPIAATAYFEIGNTYKAQALLNRALASLPERDHINTIVKFAQINNKYNQRDTAHALMEQILTSYPKRVDCWSQYVDMLVKDKDIEIARQLLERSVLQRIPMKKMRTLFKKYLDFEEKYGNEENVQKVKAMASSYVEKELKT